MLSITRTKKREGEMKHFKLFFYLGKKKEEVRSPREHHHSSFEGHEVIGAKRGEKEKSSHPSLVPRKKKRKAKEKGDGSGWDRHACVKDERQGIPKGKRKEGGERWGKTPSNISSID